MNNFEMTIANMTEAEVRNFDSVLEEAIKMGGTTIRTYSSVDGVHGLFQKELLVHGKDKGTCPECNTKIESIYSELQETSSSKETLQTELENKVNELNEFKDNYTKLKNVYESKINTLNTKIETNEEILN